ncbi:histidinol-phosphatase (PHP family) [Terribacillus aidingensis]|uniref:Histidinol-phosphatase n=1 Tax=Terribacillus aidingensis TaxID=586416 RepID=A0A285N3Y4_9BACI|nr:histidinol-phosphatase HisJ family protein [Terribacillus aidingensis]SNZ04028.1 histidinol-phosphatase (PHP family) [Terribacillus aidingensis]
MYMDYHHHTNNSIDSKAVMQDVCKEAISKGIKEICFTEHYSVNPLAPTYGHMDFTKYQADIAASREQFGDQLSIKMGIELCEPHLMMDVYEKALQPVPFDFIMGSVHNIGNQKLRLHLRANPETFYQDYFAEMYKLVSDADIDVLAHIDLMKRYAVQEGHDIYSFEQHKDQIAAILEKAIQRSIGIEINTSGMRSSLGEAMPTPQIVSLYHDLGGRILTLGSDSHKAETVGAGIKEAAQIARQCGFTHIHQFENRKPKAVPLS